MSNFLDKTKKIIKEAQDQIQKEYYLFIFVFPEFVITYSETQASISVFIEVYEFKKHMQINITFDNHHIDKSDSELYNLLIEKFSYKIEHYLFESI